MSVPARRRQQQPATGWVVPTVVVFSLAILVAGIYVVTRMFSGSPQAPAGSGLLQPSAAPISASSKPSSSPSPSITPDDLVASAQKVKPLEDIQKGDRVIYQGTVCTWQLWNKDINTSTIKCPGEKEFQIQTGRLTPVELKDGPSKLKVRR